MIKPHYTSDDRYAAKADLVVRLRDAVGWLERDGFATSAGLAREAAAELSALRAERDNLKSVMIAAAEEISAHWQVHCDAEGYGPANLMRRLEEGIPSEYAYKAGDFERLRAERDALQIAGRAALEDLEQATAFMSQRARNRAPATIEVLRAALKGE